MGFNLFPEYDYAVPRECIATEPVTPRDASRLMVVDTRRRNLSFCLFRDLPDVLPPASLLVLNETRVIPARTQLRRGAEEVEVFFLMNEYREGDVLVPVIVNKTTRPGDRFFFNDTVWVDVRGQQENVFFVEPNVSMHALIALLHRYGAMPIPRYLSETALNEEVLRERYQTSFARGDARSVAAPTASLHFTDRLRDRLRASGHGEARVTLHVGLGTFMPVTPAQLARGRLHAEPYHIPSASVRSIHAARCDGRNVVAVGTTVVRVLESVGGGLEAGTDQSGETTLFIRPPFDFALTDVLITNFHVSQSSLMCLVDAFLRYKRAPWGIRELYDVAIRERMRFYSFGDAMIIL